MPINYRRAVIIGYVPLLLLVCLTAMIIAIITQDTQLSIYAVDSGGRPIERLSVRISGDSKTHFTDRHGHATIKLTDVPAGEYITVEVTHRCYELMESDPSHIEIVSDRRKYSQSLTLLSLKPATPSLAGPPTGSTSETQPLKLMWGNISGADRYHMQVADHQSFSDPEIDREVPTSEYSVSNLAGEIRHYWRVRARNSCGWSDWSDYRYFTVYCPTPGTPSLAIPASGATGQTQPMNLSWEDISGADQYQVQVDNNSSFASPEIDGQHSSSYNYASTLREGTRYYWRVRARNDCGWGDWSASRYFTTSCALPDIPSLVEPSDGTTDRDQPVALRWGDVSGADNYQVQVDNSSSFASPEIDQQRHYTEYGVSGLTEGITYYWRVRAHNDCGWSSWSSSRRFATSSCLLPGIPILTHPHDGVGNQDQPTGLRWEEVSGVDKYQVQVDNSSAFASPEADGQSSTSDFSISGLAEGTSYYWRVRAHNNCGWSGWSDSRYFATSSCVLPNIPTLTHPSDGADSEDQPVALRWEDAAGANRYQVQVDDNSSFVSIEIDEERLHSGYDLSGLAEGETYYWRVRAHNSCGWSGWSSNRYFSTREASPLENRVRFTFLDATTNETLEGVEVHRDGDFVGVSNQDGIIVSAQSADQDTHSYLFVRAYFSDKRIPLIFHLPQGGEVLEKRIRLERQLFAVKCVDTTGIYQGEMGGVEIIDQREWNGHSPMAVCSTDNSGRCRSFWLAYSGEHVNLTFSKEPVFPSQSHEIVCERDRETEVILTPKSGSLTLTVQRADGSLAAHETVVVSDDTGWLQQNITDAGGNAFFVGPHIRPTGFIRIRVKEEQRVLLLDSWDTERTFRLVAQ